MGQCRHIYIYIPIIHGTSALRIHSFVVLLTPNAIHMPSQELLGAEPVFPDAGAILFSL